MPDPRILAPTSISNFFSAAIVSLLPFPAGEIPTVSTFVHKCGSGARKVVFRTRRRREQVTRASDLRFTTDLQRIRQLEKQISAHDRLGTAIALSVLGAPPLSRRGDEQ